MADTKETQLLVLGAGPGGYAAAFLAADKGMKVTLIDAAPRPGGTCLNVGCIPSKALLHAAKLITDARDAKPLGVEFAPPKIDVDGVRNHWLKVVDTMSKSLAFLCKARKVDFVSGRGTFLDGQSVQVNDTAYLFQHCIVATGSVPMRPAAFFTGNPRVMDSTGALKLEDVPPRLLVVGGGYIGLEMGYVYAALGSKVTVVELTEGLLPGVDRDLVQPLHKRLETLFDKIYLRTKVVKLEEPKEGIKAVPARLEVQNKAPGFAR